MAEIPEDPKVKKLLCCITYRKTNRNKKRRMLKKRRRNKMGTELLKKLKKNLAIKIPILQLSNDN